MGPVLFNLFISPLLRTGSDPAYADDSYYVTTGVTKDVALAEMQEKIRIAEKWMSGSGLKVNLKKTEMVIFHRMDTSKGSITVGGNVISSTSEMNVLGIVFDNRLLWDRQIDKTIRDTRRAAQALRTVRRYFSEDELLIFTVWKVSFKLTIQFCCCISRCNLVTQHVFNFYMPNFSFISPIFESCQSYLLKDISFSCARS